MEGEHGGLLSDGDMESPMTADQNVAHAASILPLDGEPGVSEATAETERPTLRATGSAIPVPLPVGMRPLANTDFDGKSAAALDGASLTAPDVAGTQLVDARAGPRAALSNTDLTLGPPQLMAVAVPSASSSSANAKHGTQQSSLDIFNPQERAVSADVWISKSQSSGRCVFS